MPSEVRILSCPPSHLQGVTRMKMILLAGSNSGIHFGCTFSA
jgi:hypothetical protein